MTRETPTINQSRDVRCIEPHMWTMPSGGVVCQRPRVKSGTGTGLPFFATDSHAQTQRRN